MADSKEKKNKVHNLMWRPLILDEPWKAPYSNGVRKLFCGFESLLGP